MSTERSQGDPMFLASLDLLRGLHLSKGSDYADKDDPLRNYSQSAEDNGLPAWRAAQLRLSEKYHRLINLTRADRQPEHESLDDTLLDIAALALIVRSLRARVQPPAVQLPPNVNSMPSRGKTAVQSAVSNRQQIGTSAGESPQYSRHLLAGVCRCSQQGDGCGQ